MTPIETVLEKLPHARRGGKGFMARCPAHEDSTASLSIAEGADGQVLVKCFAGCAFDAIRVALGLEAHEFFPAANGRRRNPRGARSPRKTDANVQTLPGLTPEAYATAKQLDLTFLETLGVGRAYRNGTVAVRMPYLNEAGIVVAVRFRRALDGPNRFQWRTGDKLTLYGLDRIGAARIAGAVVLCEGESDTQTLLSHGIPALGL